MSLVSSSLASNSLASEDSLWIQNAQILLPNGDFLPGDLWVKDGKIHQVGPTISPVPEGIRTIDATGLLLLPGMIDPQVHFREPGAVYDRRWSSGI